VTTLLRVAAFSFLLLLLLGRLIMYSLLGRLDSGRMETAGITTKMKHMDVIYIIHYTFLFTTYTDTIVIFTTYTATIVRFTTYTNVFAVYKLYTCYTLLPNREVRISHVCFRCRMVCICSAPTFHRPSNRMNLFCLCNVLQCTGVHLRDACVYNN